MLWNSCTIATQKTKIIIIKLFLVRLLGFLSRHIYLLYLMKPSKKVSAATKEIMDVNGEKKQC
jgi:hypothetical protein